MVNQRLISTVLLSAALACSVNGFAVVHRNSGVIGSRTSSLAVSSTETTITEASFSQDDDNKAKAERDRLTIFVGNLPFDITNQDLKEMFEAHGTVELVALPKNKQTDQPRGFAFVDMSTEAELQAAVAAIDGMTFNNRKLRAMKSVPPEERESKPESSFGQRERRPSGGNRFEDSNAKKLYVGNIPFETSKEELQEFFEQYGTVNDVFVPQNIQTGKGRGFAFITMNEEESQAAIDTANGIEFQGRTLVVNRPLPQGERTQGAGAPRNSGGPPRGARSKLYIGNLSFYTVADTLKEIFEEFGTVYDCYLPEDPSSGGTRGFGFVTMGRDEALAAVAELDGCEVDGRTIRVNEAKPKGSFSQSEDSE